LRRTALRFPYRAVACLAATALLGAAIAACGSEDSEQSLTFKLGSDGFVQGPAAADPGLTEIEFKNESGQEGDLQLIRVQGDRAPAEVSRAITATVQGKPLPDWFLAAGGVGAIASGESAKVTQSLEPGHYFALNTETKGPPEPNDIGRFEVEGEASEDEVEADQTVSAFDYGFEAEGLTSGTDEVAFENTGAQPHHIVYAPLAGDATAEDVARFFKNEKGKPPFDEKEVRSTAVTEGGETQLVELDLKKGRYVLMCFITDRKGGPPHVAKGMVDEVEVG
jgi:hypothetical protein